MSLLHRYEECNETVTSITFPIWLCIYMMLHMPTLVVASSRILNGVAPSTEPSQWPTVVINDNVRRRVRRGRRENGMERGLQLSQVRVMGNGLEEAG